MRTGFRRTGKTGGKRRAPRRPPGSDAQRRAARSPSAGAAGPSPGKEGLASAWSEQRAGRPKERARRPLPARGGDVGGSQVRSGWRKRRCDRTLRATGRSGSGVASRVVVHWPAGQRVHNR